MTLSFIVAAALLVLGQSAQSTPLDTMPSESCMTSANDVATNLQTVVDAVAGRPIKINVTGGTTAFVAENRTKITEVNLSGSVVVMRAWCELEELDRVVAMAHELGHVIDRTNDPVRYFVQLPFLAHLWNDWPTEKRANDYALEIMRQYDQQQQNIADNLDNTEAQ